MKYYLFVIGCDMNKSDAERIATVFDILGYKRAESEEEADVLLAVACSVRLSATNRVFGRGREWQKYRKRGALTMVSGCVLTRDKKKLEKYYDHIFPIEEMNKLPELLKLKKAKKDDLSEYLRIHPIYESDFRAYIPIMTGCDNFCSYCAVPYTRGREKSRTEEEIIAEVKGLIEKNYKEIILLGQNVNSYKPNFTKLIVKIDKLKGEHRIYFYSNHPKDVSGELIKALPGLKHFPNYLHLPLQSGNDEILKKMNRHYTKDSYLKLIEKIKKDIPDIVITTDIIVGFPGEKVDQFEDTKMVMENVGFDMAYISEYSERPGTLSAKMEDDVPDQEKAKREKELQKVLGRTSGENNKKLVGTTQRVLIDAKKKDKYYGRTDSYKVVEIKTDQSLEIGQFYMIEIREAGDWKLRGRI
ncbi:MAG: tRNA (N6-isopentenyl adenosine(37)-C2)-methylthiotransferase MiaB [Patescibacteria group bacterium]|nr:tRNA (N6-isopentenyl adenosine(37)-C2)-methylthiotransferase MiaB [Patescibacteria group bacterium]